MNSTQINEITQLLEINDQLTPKQWQIALHWTLLYLTCQSRSKIHVAHHQPQYSQIKMLDKGVVSPKNLEKTPYNISPRHENNGFNNNKTTKIGNITPLSKKSAITPTLLYHHHQTPHSYTPPR